MFVCTGNAHEKPPSAPMPTRPTAPPGVSLSCCDVSVADPPSQPWTEMPPQIMGPKLGGRNVDRNRAPNVSPNFRKRFLALKPERNSTNSVPPFRSTVKTQFRSTFRSPRFGSHDLGRHFGPRLVRRVGDTYITTRERHAWRSGWTCGHGCGRLEVYGHGCGLILLSARFCRTPMVPRVLSPKSARALERVPYAMHVHRNRQATHTLVCTGNAHEKTLPLSRQHYSASGFAGNNSCTCNAARRNKEFGTTLTNHS